MERWTDWLGQVGMLEWTDLGLIGRRNGLASAGWDAGVDWLG